MKTVVKEEEKDEVNEASGAAAWPSTYIRAPLLIYQDRSQMRSVTSPCFLTNTFYRFQFSTAARAMKYVALLSGGKDSCYNLLHCHKNGHELVAAASLGPQPGTGAVIYLLKC